jgi:rhodanese-related sulfurtransferase
LSAALTAFVLALGFCLRADAEVIGVVYKGDQTFLELTYVNSGKSAVRIARITTSCDCLESLDKPTEVAAGGVLEIHLIHHALNFGSIEANVELLGASGAAIANIPVRGFVADRSWSLSLADAQAKGSVLIDTRSAERFAQCHAAHAINIPAFAVKTRHDLKGNRLVLIDEGVDPADLLGEVVALRKQGFPTVFVLDGGLPGWIRGGGAVEGANTSVLGVSRISAAESYRSSRETKWQIVQMEKRLPAALGLDAAGQLDRPEDLEAVLVGLSKTWGKLAPPHILIVAPRDAVHAQLEARLGSAKGLPIYYIEGGAEALVRFHAQQLDVASNTGALARTTSRRNTPAIVGHCASCGK